jgi:hypothetical protein
MSGRTQDELGYTSAEIKIALGYTKRDLQQHKSRPYKIVKDETVGR